MSEVLPGWATITLKDVCELLNGRAYKQDELLPQGRYPVLRVGNFFSNKNWYYSDMELEPDKYCDNGDLLYAWSASFGPKIWDGGKMIYHYHIWRTRPNERVVAKRFLYYWFDWDKENIKAEHGTGSTMIHVTKGDMEARPLCLPPIPEQQRIVAKIDGASTKTKRARENLDHIPRLVEKYKQATLAAAIKGRLTANWRTSNSIKLGSGWDKQPLINICDEQRPITYGVIKLGSETPDGTPCLRTSNVRWLRVDIEGMKRIAPKLSSEYTRTILRGGEVLVNVRGTLGGVAVATPSMKGWNVSREVAVVPVDAAVVEPHYVAYWIGSDASQGWLNRVEKGVAYTGINLEDLRKLPVEFPSLEEQREIIRLIETAFAWIDRLASETTNARKLVDHLDQAILTKAFRGELVPQEPSDEPASVLLERIRTEKEVHSSIKRPTAKKKK
jgi:type I restriction enzyme, S subunit